MDIPYKEHYAKLLDSFKIHKGSTEEIESEEEVHAIDGTANSTEPPRISKGNFKYYERLQKYKNCLHTLSRK